MTSIEPEPLGPEPSVAETRETPEADEVVLEEPEAREKPPVPKGKVAARKIKKGLKGVKELGVEAEIDAKGEGT